MQHIACPGINQHPTETWDEAVSLLPNGNVSVRHGNASTPGVIIPEHAEWRAYGRCAHCRRPYEAKRPIGLRFHRLPDGVPESRQETR